MPYRRPLIPDRPSAPAGAAGSAGGATLLDAQTLARLHELDPQGQSGLVQRVLSTYTQSLQRLLQQMDAARASGDSAALRHAAHTLKSSSASVGALTLSGACADLESYLRDVTATDELALASRVDALLAEGGRVLQGLQART